ncbi:hypothetical protein IJG72_04460 [bacterium]|nr:hypothetical protein [bacterium]
MIEELLCELDKSQRAVSLLIKNFEYYVYENISGNQKINRKEFIQNIFAFTYSINLVIKDVSALKEKYYNTMYKQKYPQ